MSLRTRFALIASVALALSMLLLSVLVYVTEYRELMRIADADLMREATLVSTTLAEGGAEDQPLDAWAIRAYELRGQLVSADGRLTGLQTGPALPTTEQMLDVAGGVSDRFVTSTDVEGTTYRILTVPAPSGALVLGRSMTDVEEHLQSFAWVLLLLLLGGLGLAVIVGRTVARTSLRPVARLAGAAERLTHDRMWRHRLEVRGDDELARLSTSVNHLLDTAEQARRSQNQLVADASHELRTPLTAVWTDLEVLGDDRLGAGERERLLTEVSGEVRGLMDAVDDLLELAREASPELVMDEVAVDAVVRDAVDSIRGHRPDLQLHLVATETIRTADRAQLYRAVHNLVENAAKWSPPGGRIDVRVDDDAITVRDHGKGVPAAEMDRVFERFYRATSARGLPGSGLGLAIVRKVVEDHGWTVSVADAPGGGALFTIDLHPPRAPGLTDPDAAAGEPEHARASTMSAWAWGGSAAAVALASFAAFQLVSLDRAVPGANEPVQLHAVAGELSRCAGQYCVDGDVVDFGPIWYIREITSPHDYDGDGRRGLLGAELDGLLGHEVRLETDGGHLDQDVYTINGLPFRDDHGQLPEPPGLAQAWRPGT